MRCGFCGCHTDPWIKTVRCSSGEKVRCCDQCYEALRSVLTIIPGHTNVAGKCDRCGWYVNPRDLDPATRVHGAAKRDIYTGICRDCLEG